MWSACTNQKSWANKIYIVYSVRQAANLNRECHETLLILKFEIGRWYCIEFESAG